MATLPLTIGHAPLDGPPDADPARLEVSFLSADDTGTALLASARGRAARQAAQALGVKVLGEAGAVHVLGGLPLEATVGLGPRQEVTVETLRRAAGHAVGCATDLRR